MMNDQAHALRNLVRKEGVPSGEKSTRILTITSGKGGVGKSNFTLNFALQLQTRGYQVLVFDADVGLANIDVLMGASPTYNLYHLLKREQSIQDIIYQGYNNLQFIAGGSGFNDLLSLSQEELDYFTDQVQLLNGTYDFILFDTGAGLTKESLAFITAAEQTIVVTTPEPTSITDAYATIKIVHSIEPSMPFQLVVNRVQNKKEGQQTADKIRVVANRFLQLDIPTLGFLHEDLNVSNAVKKQVPFSILFPNSAITRDLKEVVSRFEQSKHILPNEANDGGMKRFLNRVLTFLK
jgi:flagellar biosynthesis protein FlhG